jgi:molybdopterin molybdotransferase
VTPPVRVSLAEALQPLLEGLAPVPPHPVAVAGAAGLICAAPLRATGPLPPVAIALRAGHAVRALDCVGASPQAPVWLAAPPVAVSPGDPLPPGMDAVMPPEGIAFGAGTPGTTMAEITRAIAPGENARLAGHDLRGGTLLVEEGARISPMQVLLLETAGIAHVDVRMPRVALAAGPPALCGWLGARLMAMGCRIVGEDQPADLALCWSTRREPCLALEPGNTAYVPDESAQPAIALPGRFDGMIAAFFALVLPAVARLRGVAEPVRPDILRRKVTSAIGISEIALFRTTPDGLDPLLTGAITLAALAGADRIALVDPGCEGYPAGTRIETWALKDGQEDVGLTTPEENP